MKLKFWGGGYVIFYMKDNYDVADKHNPKKLNDK